MLEKLLFGEFQACIFAHLVLLLLWSFCTWMLHNSSEMRDAVTLDEYKLYAVPENDNVDGNSDYSRNL